MVCLRLLLIASLVIASSLADTDEDAIATPGVGMEYKEEEGEEEREGRLLRMSDGKSDRRDVSKEMMNTCRDNIDYVLELVTEKLKIGHPIWMEVDPSFLPRLVQAKKIEVNSKEDEIELESEVEPNINLHLRNMSMLSQKVLGLLVERFTGQKKDANLTKLIKMTDQTDTSEYSFTHSLNKDDLRNASAENVEEEVLSRREPRQKKGKKQKANRVQPEVMELKSGNAAAIPLRIIRSGKILLRKSRGFITGAIPLRIAPIKLVPGSNLKQASNYFVHMNGAARFNFFEESEELFPEIYLVTLNPLGRFKVVIPKGKNKKKTRRRIPFNLLMRFEEEFEVNFLQELLQKRISNLIREVLSEENNKGSFIAE